MHREARHHVVHAGVAREVGWRAERALLVLLVRLVHAFCERRHHGRHVLLALWVPLDGEAVLFVPAPLVDLRDTESSLLRYSLALGITPSRVHLELLLQDHLLVTILLCPSFRLVLLALVLSGFLLFIFAFVTFLFLSKFIAFHFFILIRNRIFLQFIQFGRQFFISSFGRVIEWLLNTHVVLIISVRHEIAELCLHGHLAHVVRDLSERSPHWRLQMRRFWLINRLIFVWHI